MKKVFSTCAVITGCVVGAGFASGREMMIFFGRADPLLSATAFFTLFFAFIYVVMKAGAQYGASDLFALNKNVFGKISPLFNAVFLLNGFFALSAMLAASGALGKDAGMGRFPLSFFVTALCAAAVYLGINGVKKVEAALVPLIVVLIFFVSAGNISGASWNAPRVETVFSCARYAAYNVVLAAGVVSACAKELSKRQMVLSAAISSALLSAMILCILACYAGKDLGGAEMPLMQLAQGNAHALYGVAVGCAVITSIPAAAYPLVQWAHKKTGDKTIAVAGVFICAYVVSLFGFSKILDLVLPVTSLFAALFLAGLITAKRKPA